MMRLAPAIAIGVTSILCARAATAVPITFQFEGFVSRTNKPGTFAISEAMTGRYTFESTTPDLIVQSSQGGFVGAVSHFSFTSGSYSVTADAGDIIVNTGSSYSVFLIAGPPDFEWGPYVAGEPLVRIWLALSQPAMGALPSDDLPLSPPSLGDFSSAALGLFFKSDETGPIPPGGGGVIFTLTRLARVPEPATTGLLGAGLLALGCRSRRRTR